MEKNIFNYIGGMAERIKAAGLKPVVFFKGTVGSNPTPSAII